MTGIAIHMLVLCEQWEMQPVINVSLIFTSDLDFEKLPTRCSNKTTNSKKRTSETPLCYRELNLQKYPGNLKAVIPRPGRHMKLRESAAANEPIVFSFSPLLQKGPGQSHLQEIERHNQLKFNIMRTDLVNWNKLTGPPQRFGPKSHHF